MPPTWMPDAKPLGIDRLGLEGDDRVIILALVLVALTRRWSDDLVPGGNRTPVC